MSNTTRKFKLNRTIILHELIVKDGQHTSRCGLTSSKCFWYTQHLKSVNCMMCKKARKTQQMRLEYAIRQVNQASMGGIIA